MLQNHKAGEMRLGPNTYKRKQSAFDKDQPNGCVCSQT